MEEEMIDLWYEEQKQLLSEHYIKCIDRGMNLERRERKFTKAMDALNKKYNRKYSSFLRKIENKKRRKEFWGSVASPFCIVGRGILFVFRFFWGVLSGGFKAKCGSMHFHLSMFWIHNGYKITDSSANAFRPVYYFYVKHLQIPLRILASPFVDVYRSEVRLFISIKEAIKNLAGATGKSSKKVFKVTIKAVSSFSKNLSSKHEELSKQYHEWYSKRLQASLDAKQKKKEDKERKKKEKEARKREKLGLPPEGEKTKEADGQNAPEEAPDAETTT